MCRFKVDEPFLFVGRTFEEYCRMFGLDPSSLAEQSVLDCPGGPSSFSAVAGEIAEATIAVDPMYGQSARMLEVECQDAIERTLDQLREKRELFVWGEYGDVETRGRYLRAATERFCADYAATPGRYLAAGLPDLPLESDAVDLALSANFLFLYDDRLSLSMHVESLQELARVARREVRVFPLHSLDRERSDLVDTVVERLREMGITVRFESVPYEFQPGATTALVLTDVEGVELSC